MNPKSAERLSKLIPRLASDSDPEVIATVRAIIATLASTGKDLHDLAALVKADAAPRFNPEQSKRDWAAWQEYRPRAPDHPPFHETKERPKQKRATKPRSPRPPIPLWDRLGHDEILVWLRRILAEAELSASDRVTFDKILAGVLAGCLFLHPEDNDLFEKHVANLKLHEGAAA